MITQACKQKGKIPSTSGIRKPQAWCGQDALPWPRAEAEPVIRRGRDACAPRPNDSGGRRRKLGVSCSVSAGEPPPPATSEGRSCACHCCRLAEQRLDLLGHHACRGTTAWATTKVISSHSSSEPEQEVIGTAACVVKGRHVRAFISETADASLLLQS
jgi:hypothetical protein